LYLGGKLLVDLPNIGGELLRRLVVQPLHGAGDLVKRPRQLLQGRLFRQLEHDLIVHAERSLSIPSR
jgi:hypothetical protein